MRYIEVRLDQSLQTKEVIEASCKVVAESKTEIVVNNKLGREAFCILDKVKAKKGYTQFNMLPEDISVDDYSTDKYFRDSWGYFVLRVYTNSTSKKILANKMSRALNKYLDKKRKEYACYVGSGKVNIFLG